MATATDVAEVLATHPKPSEVDREALARCIAECFDRARSCTVCADADLAEEDLSESGDASACASTAPRSASITRTAGQTGSMQRALVLANLGCEHYGDRRAALLWPRNFCNRWLEEPAATTR